MGREADSAFLIVLVERRGLGKHRRINKSDRERMGPTDSSVPSSMLFVE
jgi:hypothetical protein